MPLAKPSQIADVPGHVCSSDELCAVVEPRMVAALYVAKDGAYFGVPGVDPWDEVRDARRYAGPWLVRAA